MPYRPRTLLCGMKGADVDELKYWLNIIGMHNFLVDGVAFKQRTMLPFLGGSPTPAENVFDSLTFFRVKEFQKLNGLKQDGVVGKKTYAMIDKWLNELEKSGLVI